MIVNTAPFDVSGHPATSVPAGLADGLPAGLMIVGRHFDDATCLRAAHAFETAVGGFPSPPGA
jgi:amidase